MTATILAFPRPRAVASLDSFIGVRLSYEDCANPRRCGTITGAFNGTNMLRVEWDGGGASSIYPASVPTEINGRDAGWRRLPAETLSSDEIVLRNAIAEIEANRRAKERARLDALCYGPKYNRDLTTAQIAALVRGEIKAAQKAGTIAKGVKVSVRSDSFSGGSAIRISVTACSFPVMDREYLAAEKADPHGSHRDVERYTTEASALLAMISGMAAAYNFDKSDAQSDYFHVNFYDGRATFDHRIEDAERVAFAAVAK